MPADAGAEDVSILIVMGVSGSGKSTIAKLLADRLGWPYEDGDRFHPQSNVDKMHAGHPLTDADRWPWLDAIAAHVDVLRRRGEKCVIACSVLKRVYRDIVIGDRPDMGLVYLKGDRALIAERIASRHGHFMPPKLLDSQFETLEEPAADEHPLTVSIAPTPDEIVDAIVEKLARAARPLSEHRT